MVGADGLRDRLAGIGRVEDGPFDAAEAALWLSKWMDAEVEVPTYLRHLEHMVDAARAFVADASDDADMAVDAARQMVARRFGYGPPIDTDTRATRNDLARVMDRRRGSGAALAAIYAHVLRALDHPPRILDFPPRPLLAMDLRTGPAILDPGQGLRVLSIRQLRRILDDEGYPGDGLGPDRMAPLSSRGLVLRLADAIMTDHLNRGAPEAAARVLEGAVLLAPDSARAWMELGGLLARLGRDADAVRALERFLALPGLTEERYTAAQMLQRLKRNSEDTP
ncbi:MAG: tetratricopeptide repeat protein [Alphaproteobacteria bacterium]|nr:tetratricopeptide repeat protein [Alphaproteobacteria bacterium]